jgi:hypothetical protein
MNTENKPIVVICSNGIVKFFNKDGTRNIKQVFITTKI